MDATEAHAAVAAYYRDPHVRARLLECLDDHPNGLTSAAYIAGFDPRRQPNPTWWSAEIGPPTMLVELAERGCDLSRSLWDERALIVLLDLDYQNLDYPAEPFTHATNVFFKLESTYAATARVLRRFGLAPLVTGTGRGYHFVGRIPLDAPVVDELAALTSLPAWYGTYLSRRPPGVMQTMSARQARAAAGLGLVIEYLAHLILKHPERPSLVPMVVNGTTVGSGILGRECVSIDFSHMGDPLDLRHVRVGFSTYQWHRARPDIFGDAVAALPPIATLPRRQRTLESFLLDGRDLASAANVARTADNGLPDLSTGMARLVARYRRSPLAAFHARFADEWREALRAPGRAVPADLPPCVIWPLECPNDLLLKPEYLQNLVRGLMARNWTAGEIARLVADEYAQDHRWGDRWMRLDLHTRAEFDIRVFAGLLVTGSDPLIDFNCTSSQEKGVCPFVGCAHDLREDRDRLLTRFAS